MPTCKTCGHTVALKRRPEPLPSKISHVNLTTGGWIQSAELRSEHYSGLQNSTLYPCHVPIDDIDWDDWRQCYVCPGCKKIAVREHMLIQKQCEHCGGWFERSGKFTPYPYTWPMPTRSELQKLASDLQKSSPGCVVEYGRLSGTSPPLWHPRDEDQPPTTLREALREGRIVVSLDTPDWLMRICRRFDLPLPVGCEPPRTEPAANRDEPAVEGAGWSRHETLTDCVVCDRCNEYTVSKLWLQQSHKCALPTALGKRLYFHEVPEQWPYASKGQTCVRVPDLASWLRALPPWFREELMALLSDSPGIMSPPPPPATIEERVSEMQNLTTPITKQTLLAAAAGAAAGVAGTLGYQELLRLKKGAEALVGLLEAAARKAVESDNK